jgi:vitamin B12 transporter
LAALEWLRQDVDKSDGNYTVRSRTVKSMVLGLNGSQGGHDWQLSARHDHNSQFGKETTGSAGYGIHFLDDWRAGVVVGTSFVAPSFNMLYWPDYGNPALKPQHGLSREVNLGWAAANKSIKVTRYDNRIHDFLLIDQNSASNLDGVRLSGWTLAGTLSTSIGDTRIFANGSFDWLDAHNMATGEPLVRRADRSTTLLAGMEMGGMTVELSVKGRCGAPDNNPVSYMPDHLPGYAVWGASASWRLTPEWKLVFRADNIGNHAYETSYGYNQPGNQYFLTLSYAMKAL